MPQTDNKKDNSQVRSEMGNKEVLESSYTIIRYAGFILPNRYRNLIRSRWMRSFRHGNHYIGLCDSDSYFEAYSRYIDRILCRLTIVRFAVLSEDHDVVLGFSIMELGQYGTILHYVHVQKDYRQQGIAKKLVPPFDTFTHLTKTGMKLWSTKAPKAKFNPFI